jgi:hypothetical protein
MFRVKMLFPFSCFSTAVRSHVNHKRKRRAVFKKVVVALLLLKQSFENPLALFRRVHGPSACGSNEAENPIGVVGRLLSPANAVFQGNQSGLYVHALENKGRLCAQCKSARRRRKSLLAPWAGRCGPLLPGMRQFHTTSFVSRARSLARSRAQQKENKRPEKKLLQHNVPQRSSSSKSRRRCKKSSAYPSQQEHNLVKDVGLEECF